MENYVLMHSARENSFFITNDEKYSRVKLGKPVRYQWIQDSTAP